ncbi:hypothetical protein ACFY2N_27500 [Streptomyces rubiginosohelvolus]|uniref:hypothetical protein n=1 Tax=Streptomyces rubiginosohelvolus TaxID=67362 RepID=UPI0036C082E1
MDTRVGCGLQWWRQRAGHVAGEQLAGQVGAGVGCGLEAVEDLDALCAWKQLAADGADDGVAIWR